MKTARPGSQLVARSLPDRSTPADEASTQRRIEEKVRSRLFASEPVPMRIGRFLVLELIGSGGMGTVYAAYDEQLDRKVAVKVLLEDQLPSETERLRFLREAQALARLSHPNVVTVHEVGESDGEVFLAMEYVSGQSLAAWLRTKPEWRQVMEAFTQAGEGLVAAHHADIVHRDLKPANIVRSDDGAVKVLDFGLARVAAHELDESVEQLSASSTGSHAALYSSLTQTGTVMGTPAYMAPEQFTGEGVDEHSDQYSFCIALWEGLAGERPFQGQDAEAMLSARLAGPPSWPDSAPPVPRSIIEVVRRGLSVDPEDRWPSMEALLHALSPNPRRRRRRRRRWRLGLTAAAMLCVVGMTAQAWSYARAQQCNGARLQLAGVWDDARRAEVEVAMQGVGPSYASGVWVKTQRELDAYAETWVAMHTETCEATAIRAEQSSRVLDLRMQCLQRAAGELRATVDTLADADAKVVREAHELVASLRSLSLCADTEALEADVEPPQPRDAAAVEQARQHLARAMSERRAGRYEAAERAQVAATEALEEASYGPARTELMLERGHLLKAQGDYEGSEEALLEALESAVRWNQRELIADAGSVLMYVVGSQQQRPEAAMLLVPLVLGSVGDDPVMEANARSRIGAMLYVQGKYEQAEAEQRAALALRAAGLEPGHPEIATSRNNLAVVLHAQGKYEEAEAEQRAALESWMETLGPDHPSIAKSRNNIGRTLQAQGKLEEAEAEFRASWSVAESALGPDHPEVAMVRNNLAVVLQDQGKYAEAETEYVAARVLWEKTLGPEHPNVAAARNNFATILYQQGKYAEAEPEFRAALVLSEKSLGPDHPNVASSRDNIAHVLQLQGKFAEAEAEHRMALAAREKALGPDHPEVASSKSSLAYVLLELDREDEARPLAEQAWTRHQREDVSADQRAATAFLLARILWRIEGLERDRTRAEGLAEDALRSYRVDGDAQQDAAVEVERWLAEHRAALARRSGQLR